MAEKEINEISRDARVLFNKGNEAAQRDNIEYAIALYNQVLDKEPGFFECRKLLRELQFKKTGGGGGLFKRMLSGAKSSPLVAQGQIALHTNPASALGIAEQILNSDPNSSAGHRLVVQASQALDLPRTGTMSLEILVKNSPKDKNLAIEFANSLSASGGDTKRGEQVLIDLLRLTPNDGELNQALKNLSARTTMDEGGYAALEGGKGSYRDILRDKKEAVSLEQEKRVVKTEDTTERLIGEYEARLLTEPKNLKLYRTLAELYTQKNQFDKAMELFDRVKNSEMGNDPSLERAMAKTIERRFDFQMEQLDPAAPEYAEQKEKLAAEKLIHQVTECQQRVEKYPTDLAIRYEMGVLYFQTGKVTEAIQEFQRARGNPHKRLSAMGYLAQCYARRKMYDLAAGTLQEAIKEKTVFDDDKKELVYNLGSVLESMGKKEEAIEQFKIIYAVDSGYKDVGPKVEASYGGQ